MCAKFRLLPFLNSQKQGILGLDLGTASIKLLVLKPVSQNYRVECYVIEDLLQAAKLDSCITSSVKKLKTLPKQVAIALPDPQVTMKVIQMKPGLNENELVAQLHIVIESLFSYDAHAFYFDYQVLGPSSQNPALLDVLLVVSPSQAIDNLVGTFHVNGLDIKIVDVKKYAIERVIAFMVAKLSDKLKPNTIALVDIGATQTSFSLLHQEKIVYTRELIFGGNQLTEAIEPFRERVIQEMKSTFQLFLSSNPSLKIDHIFLAGGTAMLSGLVACVERTLGIPTEIVNPFKHMLVSPQVNVEALAQDASKLFICCGLALRNMGL